MGKYRGSKVIVVIDGERHIFERDDITVTVVKTRSSGVPSARMEITVPLDATEVMGEGGKYIRALNTSLT